MGHAVYPTHENLSLPGTSDRPIGAAGGRGGSIRLVLAVGIGLAHRGHLVVLHVDERLLASVAARAASLGGLLVGGNVEGDEEEEVGADDGHSREGGEFFSRALAHVGSPREIGGREVGVGREVDKA